MKARITSELLANKARLFDFRVWLLQVGSFFLASWVVASSLLVGGWLPLSSDSVFSIGGFWLVPLVGTVISTTWVGSLLTAMIFGAKDKLRRSLWAWVFALVAGLLMGLAVAGASQAWGAFLVAGLVGIGLVVPLRKWFGWTEQSRMTSVGIPAAMLPAARALPSPMPPRVRQILDAALRDWQDLRELLRHEQALGRAAKVVDIATLLSDSDRSLNYILRRASVVSKLEDLASRSSELAAREAADVAVRRLSQAGTTLHEAVKAASKLTASEDRDEAYVLRARVDGLQEFAAGLEAADHELEAEFEMLESEFGKRERGGGVDR